MYGTIAKLKAKPGVNAATKARELRATLPSLPEGFVAEFLYETGTDEYHLVVIFEDKERYQAHSANPQTHARFLQIAEMLAAEPEWHDGYIVYSEISKSV